MDKLLWVDLETTGDDRERDEILEVAAVLTDANLVTKVEFNSAAGLTLAGAARLAELPVVMQMHAHSGLLADLGESRMTRQAHAEWLAQVETEILSWFGPEEKITLAGSGVASFDKVFIEKHMPRLGQRLTYFSMDIGPVRRFYKLACGENLVEANADKTHRALDDIRCHLAEARAFQNYFLENLAVGPGTTSPFAA